MKPGRPKGLKRKHVKQYVRAGRYDVRIKRLHDKAAKLDMLRVLIFEYERQAKPDFEYIADLRKRFHKLQLQCKVLSTTDVIERP